MTMYTHEDITALYQKGIQMLKAINVPVSDHICPVINFAKAHSWYGMCGRFPFDKSQNFASKPGTKYYLRFSEYALGNSEKSVMNTVLHELIHTCPNCHGHGTVWKHWAAVVNRAYGYNIQRCGGDKTDEDSANLRGGYRRLRTIGVRCTCCGATFMRTRESRLTLHPEDYKCHCGGTLERI